MEGCGEKETPLGETVTILFLQVGLALYLGNMFKTMVGASKKLQAESAMASHPNAFPSTPKTTTAEWDLLQMFDYRTLLCTQVLKGNTAVWQSAIQTIVCMPSKQRLGTFIFPYCATKHIDKLTCNLHLEYCATN